MAELNIAPAIIFLRLNGGRNDWIDSNDGDNKEDPIGFERLESCAEQRTRFVDRMPQRQRRGKNRQPLEMELENTKKTELSAIEQPIIARNNHPDNCIDTAVAG